MCKLFNEEFSVIDEQEIYNSIYSSIGWKIDPSLFEINGPFIMDSEFEALKDSDMEVFKAHSKSRRKRKLKDESDLLEIIKIAESVCLEGQKIGYFKIETSNKKNNNKIAREAAKRALSVNVNFFGNPPIISEQIIEPKCFDDISDMTCNRMISNWIKSPTESIVIFSEDHQFLLPPNSMFHIGEISDLWNTATISNLTGFDLIIADPPWINKSVKRKKIYQTSDHVLDNINLNEIMSENCLILFWITNRTGIREEVKARFDKWDLKIIGEWKWLKVTKEGKPVYSFSKTSHKLPYESVLFATSNNCEKFEHFPKKHVFASIPMAVHSRKPPITHILQKFGYRFHRPLELFARSLFPGTTSIGYEPLLLQSSNVFVKI